MTEQPYDVVGYWHGHERFGAVGPYPVMCASYVDAVLETLSDWDFLQFCLRNGQVIRVRPRRSLPATARCE